MSPEDQLLQRMVMCVGIGIGALCLLVAVFVQVRLCRAGKASRGDLLGLIGVIVGLAILTAYEIYWEPVGRGALAEKAVMSTLAIACSISLLYRILQFIVHTLTLETTAGVRAILPLTGSAAGIALILLLVANILPKPAWLQAVVLFTGTMLGLLLAWPSRATNTRGTAPDEKPSPIIRAGS